MTSPTSTTADPAAASASRERPRVVNIALVVLYAVLALKSLNSVFDQAPGRRLGAVFMISFLALFQVALIFFAGKRKNWARILLLVMGAWSILASGNVGLLSDVVGMGEMTASVIALVLLFLPASAAWFREPPTSSAITIVLIVVLWVLFQLGSFVVFYNIFSRETAKAELDAGKP
jgi:hypothetical protein